MTVTYTSEVATAKKFGIFWKLLFRWRGSIYKLIWPEMIVYLLLYYTLRFVYAYALTAEQRLVFEQITLYFQNFSDLIPLTFVLGFYVNIVMSRWWEQYKILPWPDNLAIFVSTSIHGLDDRGRLMRRTIMRYVNLSFVMTLTMMSMKVKKRFPTHDHLVEAGFMTKSEKEIFAHLDELYPLPKYWMPLVWAGTVVTRARKEGRIRDDFAVKTILDAINTFRQGCGGLLGYDKMSIPLVYTQVVTLAVYTFLLSTLMARQYLDPAQNYEKHNIDLYVPWFTILQFIFYMGWLKVAETLVNPFGEDDDDFDVNYLVDRHFQVCYLIVDGMHCEHPELIQDKYWEEGFPQELPYTIATEQFRKGPHLGSTANMEIPKSQQFFLRPVAEADSETDSDEGLTTPGEEKKTFKYDPEAAKTGRSASIAVRSKNRRESDSDSDLWITPRSLVRNQSILSTIRNQLGGNITHRKLTKESSSASGQGGSSTSLNRPSTAGAGAGAGAKLLSKPSLSRKMSGSPLTMKKIMSQTSKQGSTIFHMSLESLKEEDSKASNKDAIEEEEEDDEGERKEEGISFEAPFIDEKAL